MKTKITVILLIVIILSVSIYYKRTHYTTSKTNYTTSTKENPIITYDYETSTDSNVNVIYLITSDKTDYNFKKYVVKENETIEIPVLKNKGFIISLHANKTMAAKWELKDDLNVLKLEKMNWIELNENNNEKATGVSKARQYFYFDAKSEGSEVLEFTYKHTSEKEEYFKFFVNVKLTNK